MHSSRPPLLRAALITLVAALAVLPALHSPATAAPTQSWANSAACSRATSAADASQDRLAAAKSSAKKTAKKAKQATRNLTKLTKASAPPQALAKAKKKQKAAKKRAKQANKALATATAAAQRAATAKAPACVPAKPISPSARGDLTAAADMLSLVLFTVGAGQDPAPALPVLTPARRANVLNAMVADASRHTNPTAFAVLAGRLQIPADEEAAEELHDRIAAERPAFTDAFDESPTAFVQLFADTVADHALPGFTTARFDEFGTLAAVALALDEVYDSPLTRYGWPDARLMLSKVARGGDLTSITRRDAANTYAGFLALEPAAEDALSDYPALVGISMDIAGSKLNPGV